MASGWSDQWSQAGAEVTATGLASNRDLAPGETMQIGFDSGADTTPALFRINGSACA